LFSLLKTKTLTNNSNTKSPKNTQKEIIIIIINSFQLYVTLEQFFESKAKNNLQNTLTNKAGLARKL
jgi:hypothetical protein